MTTSSFGQDGGDGAGVRGEAALEHDDRFGLLERGQPALELHVDVHRAGNRAHRSRADAEPARWPRARASRSFGCVVSPR